MSWLSRTLFGDRNGQNIDSRHVAAGYSRGAILAGDPGAITPANPGSLTPYRAAKTIKAPTIASMEQAHQLSVAADEMDAIAGWTEQAYKAATKVEQAQTRINKAHFKYATDAANAALATADAVGKYGNALETVRGKYGKIAGAFDAAHRSAEDDLRHVELEFYGVLTGAHGRL